MKNIRIGIKIGYFLAFIATIFLFWSCFSINSPQLNILFLVSGGLVGWMLGVLITPISDTERKKFSEFGKAIATFLTGFLLAKIERIFELAVQDKSDISDIFIGRSLILIGSFVLGVLSTFIWRSYVTSQKMSEKSSGQRDNADLNTEQSTTK
jgi:F0F1-type ATP synthase assembly protein I